MKFSKGPQFLSKSWEWHKHWLRSPLCTTEKIISKLRKGSKYSRKTEEWWCMTYSVPPFFIRNTYHKLSCIAWDIFFKEQWTLVSSHSFLRAPAHTYIRDSPERPITRFPKNQLQNQIKKVSKPFFELFKCLSLLSLTPKSWDKSMSTGLSFCDSKRWPELAVIKPFLGTHCDSLKRAQAIQKIANFLGYTFLFFGWYIFSLIAAKKSKKIWEKNSILSFVAEWLAFFPFNVIYDSLKSSIWASRLKKRGKFKLQPGGKRIFYLQGFFPKVAILEFNFISFSAFSVFQELLQNREKYKSKFERKVRIRPILKVIALYWSDCGKWWHLECHSLGELKKKEGGRKCVRDVPISPT